VLSQHQPDHAKCRGHRGSAAANSGPGSAVAPGSCR
jgi:hypothetical protein